MKILTIRGKNLASLEGEFEIDFTVEPLKSAGIFAITGNTGSGKSTILDALCLALFDDTPRTNRAAENNIQIADVKDKTVNQKDSRNILRRGTSDGYAEVDFVSLGGECFRSRWSVRRSRDKVDGSLQSSEFRLINLSENTEVPGRKTELLAKIVELIGLTFYQFTRAVLLAQGDFATFLKATQKEKAELLEKLTGTDIYSRISTSIYERAKSAEQDFHLLKERIEDVELLTEERSEQLFAEKKGLVQEVEALKTELSILTAKMKWLTDKEMLSSNVQQAEEILLAAQKAMEEAAPRYAYLAQADTAQEIRDAFFELKNSQSKLAEHVNNLAKHELEIQANAALLKETIKKHTLCETQEREYREKVANITPQIQQARELDVKLSGIKINLAEAEKEYMRAAEEKMKVEKQADGNRTTISGIEQNINTLHAWFDEYKQYKEIITRIDLILSLLDDVAMARRQCMNHTKILKDSQLILDGDANQLAHLQTEAERLNHLLPAEIAVFREKLQEGNPCPVCGSLHHPLGSVVGETLQEKELNRSKKEVGEKIALVTTQIEKRKGEHIRLQSMIESYTTQANEISAKLEDYLTVLPSWQEQLEHGALQNRLREFAGKWNENTALLTKMNEQMIHLQTVLKSEQENLQAATQSHIVQEQKYKNVQAQFEELQKNRNGLLRGKSASEVEKICADKEKELLDNLKKITEEKNSIIIKSEKYSGAIAQIKWEIDLLTEHCCDLQNVVNDWIEFKNGPFTMELLSELTQPGAWLVTERETLDKLKEWKVSAEATFTERNSTLATHNEAAIKPLEEQTKEILLELLGEKDLSLQEKTARLTEIEILFTNHQKGIERIKVFEKELVQKLDLAENWKKLNEMFGSADGARFKVLAQGYTLDALLIYANKHLQELSRRYELQRIPDTLALQVADLDMLGEIRTVHSLSGGESFLISLALALGLSSLSSNRMKVESLFIDEGFGSLDIDTLRVAMDALERLQTQGRKIGVISHVAEMTERITTQIRVVKTVNGRSRIEVVG